MAIESNPPADAGEQASTGNGFRNGHENNYSQRGNDKRGGNKRKRGGGFGSKKYVNPFVHCLVYVNANSTDQTLGLKAPTSASKYTTTAWTSAAR